MEKKYIIISISFFILGFCIGMVFQQAVIVKDIIDILSYSEVEVNINLNETKLVEEINNTFSPLFKEEFNNSNNEEEIFYSPIPEDCDLECEEHFERTGEIIK